MPSFVRREEIIILCPVPSLQIIAEDFFKSGGKGDDLLPSVLHHPQMNRHSLKVDVGDQNVDDGAGTVSSRDQIVDCRPSSPFCPSVGGGFLQQPSQFCVCVRLFDLLVFFHQLQGQREHIFSFSTKPEEDTQPTDSCVEGGYLLASIQLTDDEPFKDFLRDLINIPFGNLALEIVDVFLIKDDGFRSQVPQFTMIDEGRCCFLIRDPLDLFGVDNGGSAHKKCLLFA